MAGITIDQAEARLTAWLEADAAVSSGQEYEIDTGNGRRRLKRADAAEIRANITFWDEKVKNLAGASAGGRRRIRYVVNE
jgi:hypothetical protein